MPSALSLQDGTIPPSDQLLDLYQAVGRRQYTDDSDALIRAVTNSTYVLTGWQEGRLIGLIRCLSDDVSIVYLQDILVHPDWQGQGIGRQLLEACLERYDHVRQKVLLTDDEERQRVSTSQWASSTRGSLPRGR